MSIEDSINSSYPERLREIKTRSVRASGEWLRPNKRTLVVFQRTVAAPGPSFVNATHTLNRRSRS